MIETQTLTTGQAAKYCHVSQTTIINWIKRGELKAHATPGGHHRILLSDLISFLESYEMPIDSALRASAQPRVLIVGNDHRTPELAAALRKENRVDVSVANNAYEVGAQMIHFQPAVVVLDTTSPALDVWALCRWLDDTPRHHAIGKIAVGPQENEATALAAGVDMYVANGDKLEQHIAVFLAAHPGAPANG